MASTDNISANRLYGKDQTAPDSTPIFYLPCPQSAAMYHTDLVDQGSVVEETSKA